MNKQRSNMFLGWDDDFNDTLTVALQEAKARTSPPTSSSSIPGVRREFSDPPSYILMQWTTPTSLVLLEVALNGKTLFNGHSPLIMLRIDPTEIVIDSFFLATEVAAKKSLAAVLKANNKTLAVFGMEEIVDHVQKTSDSTIPIRLHDAWRAKPVTIDSDALKEWTSSVFRDDNRKWMSPHDYVSKYMLHRAQRLYGTTHPSERQLSKFLEKTHAGGFYGFAGFKQQKVANIDVIKENIKGLHASFVDRAIIAER